jgi:pilus assembly protein CpaB
MFLLKLKYVIPLALVTGFLATYGVFNYLSGIEDPNKESEVVIRQVVVASRDLLAGITLSATDLKVSEWPEGIVPGGSYEELELIQGRVINTDLTSGEPVLTTKLAPEGSSGGISSIIPDGMRALTVAVNVVSGVSGFILPKTRVDVLVTVAPTTKKAENTTKTILQNVEVLAVDQTYQQDGDEPITVKSVTLLVTPEEAEKLALAGNEGKLQLSLRGNVDAEVYSTKGVKMSQLIKQPKPKRTYRPAKSSKPKVVEAVVEPKVVEIYRANIRTEVELDEDEVNSANGNSGQEAKKP